MMQTTKPALTIELKHTGEQLTLRRVRTASGVEQLHLSGTLPPHRQGPPHHVHFPEDEQGEVVSGILSASLMASTFKLRPVVARGFPSAARIGGGDGDKELVFQGVATSAVDLDRYLRALVEVLNAGAPLTSDGPQAG